jgi:hypothetical protein
MTGMLEEARAQGHYVRDGETEDGIVTRMIVEGWVGEPHFPTYMSPSRGPVRCRCLPMFPEFLGPDSIKALAMSGPSLAPALSLCRYHAVGITCEACPQCVRCRRRMSSDLGHWVCDKVVDKPLDT